MDKGEYNAGERPSGHNISEDGFFTDSGGAIPDNLLSTTNTGSQTHHNKMCKRAALDRHPARFPKEIPEFFVKFLTPNTPYGDWDRGRFDKPVVLDIFGGSNITGKIAEELGRYWLAFEKNEKYLEASEVRFLLMMQVERKFNDTQRGLDEFTNDCDSSSES
jgi:site-specific DNA-methyltransferase (cytosine-N4-specific)